MRVSSAERILLKMFIPAQVIIEVSQNIFAGFDELTHNLRGVRR